MILAASALALITVTADNIGYGGVMLGDPRAVVERKLRRRLPPIRDEDVQACGEYTSLTYIGGYAVSIQWADRTARAVVESLIVDIRDRRGTLPPGLTEIGVSFYPRKGQKAVLFFSGPEEPARLYIYDPECTD